MEDEMDISLDKQVIRHVILNEPEPRITGKVGDVLRASGDQVVDTDNGVPLCDEPVAEMRTEESGAAGDNRGGHCRSGKCPGNLIRG